MTTKTKRGEELIDVRRYEVQYPVSAYTFPREARIHQITIGEKYLQIQLTDERILSIPLWWIPTVYNAQPEERNKFEINPARTMIIWDPDKCAINDEVRLADYLGPIPVRP